MKASAVYRKAAAMMFDGAACSKPDCGWPCCAIASSLPDPYPEYRKFTQEFIRWFGADFDASATIEEQHDISMALLLMSEIAKDSE